MIGETKIESHIDKLLEAIRRILIIPLVLKGTLTDKN